SRAGFALRPRRRLAGRDAGDGDVRGTGREDGDNAAARRPPGGHDDRADRSRLERILPQAGRKVAIGKGERTVTTTFPLLRRSLLACLVCLCLLLAGRASELPRGDAKAAGFAPEKLERIPAALKQAVDKKQVAGAAALIARHGKVVYRANVGKQDVEGDVPLADATIFRIASMSKPITSVAVMILVDDGKLRVTDPLSHFLPD